MAVVRWWKRRRVYKIARDYMRERYERLGW